MRRVRRLFLSSLLVALIALPLIVWFAYPPSRVLLPSLAPITCGQARVCVDDITQLPRAQALYDEAFAFVTENVGQIEVPPKMYFCAGQECSDHFGWESVGGYNVGVFGAVIKPSGWRDYIVRHEMIHHLQNERLGLLAALINNPPWLLEGMAYSLSGDPRRPLTWDADLETQRATFETWFRDVGQGDLWTEAAKLTR